MNKKEIIFILNSDFGGHQIGGRAKHIVSQMKNSSKALIYCRDYESKNNSFHCIKVVPKGKFIMQVLTAIPIYITKKIPSGYLKIKIFEYFLLKKIKKIDLSTIKIIHSCDYIPNVYKYIKSINPNIKIFQDVPIASSNILKKLNKPELEFIGESLEAEKTLLQSIKYIDSFIVPSHYVKDSLIDLNINRNKIQIIPFGVDISKFKPIKKNNKKLNIAFSGNVNNRKGVKYLIQAIKKINNKHINVNLYGRVYPEIQKYLKNSQKFNIKVHGFVDISKELPKNDLYVFPTLMEGSSKSVYEAMACKIPVITTYNAGSIITNNKDGFIISTQNVNEIVDKINYFIKNKKKLITFGNTAYKNVQKYTWEKYGKEVLKYYTK